MTLVKCFWVPEQKLFFFKSETEKKTVEIRQTGAQTNTCKYHFLPRVDVMQGGKALFNMFPEALPF